MLHVFSYSLDDRYSSLYGVVPPLLGGCAPLPPPSSLFSQPNSVITPCLMSLSFPGAPQPELWGDSPLFV